MTGVLVVPLSSQNLLLVPLRVLKYKMTTVMINNITFRVLSRQNMTEFVMCCLRIGTSYRGRAILGDPGAVRRSLLDGRRGSSSKFT